MLNRCVIVYIDDILFYSESLTEHVGHVRTVLKRLIDHQVFKIKKCEFHRTLTAFLGYVISPEGVTIDDSKVRAVLDWSQPETIKELQRFLGFYRRFIRNFSMMASTLTSMTKGGGRKLTWTPEAIEAFQELKNHFTSAPILHHPDPELPLTLVEVDASNTGKGAILSQRLNVLNVPFPLAN